jgi:hypothetical protein
MKAALGQAGAVFFVDIDFKKAIIKKVNKKTKTNKPNKKESK